MAKYIYRNGMSSLGSCLKSLVAKRLGYEPLPPSDKIMKVFEEGNKYEDLVVFELKQRGFRVSNQQQELKLWVGEEVALEGHLDGKIRRAGNTGLTESRVLEVKSKSASEWKNWLDKGWDAEGLTQKYKWQVSCYMAATGLPLMFVVVPRTGLGELELDISIVDEPFYNRDDINRRVGEIEKWAAKGELPPLCEKGVSTISEYFCPFSYLHEGVEEEIIEDSALDTLAMAYVSSLREEKVAKKKKQDTYRALIELVKKKGKCKTDGFLYTPWTTKDGRVDIKRLVGDLEEMVPEIDLEKYRNQEISDRVTVKERNG